LPHAIEAAPFRLNAAPELLRFSYLSATPVRARAQPLFAIGANCDERRTREIAVAAAEANNPAAFLHSLVQEGDCPMIRALMAALALLMLAGCSSHATRSDVAADPLFNGVYRLAYSGTGQALYYRFYPDGIVLSARSDAPADLVIGTLDSSATDTSRGQWQASDGQLRVSVDEGTVRYESRFDINAGGRIALRGLPRAFDFIPEGSQAGLTAR
jgi:hypothetical protein